MSDEFSFDISESTFSKLSKKKNDMGFQNKSWNEWFNELFKENDNVDSDFIEKAFEKKNYQQYYDDWIKNFGDNLLNIRQGNSVKELIPTTKHIKSAIIIGGGPSLKKYNHLKLLAESNFDGAIICSDGSLPNILESGITPDKFKNFYVVTVDSQVHQKNFYENPISKKFGNNIKCILSTTVPLSTYESIKDSNIEIFWINALFDYNKGKSSFNYIEGILSRSKHNPKGLPGIQTGGNVGTFAWVISWSILKCSEVCLIGMDESYPVDNPSEKIDPTAIGRVHPQFIKILNELENETSDDVNAINRAFPLIFNPDFNCYCRQDPVFLYYANAFREFIAKTQNKVKTINATEGGALFGCGIHSMKFKEYLDLKN